MVVVGHARQRRAGFALAAGGERKHVGAGQPVERVRSEEAWQAVEIAALARDPDHALHRASEHDDLAPRRKPRQRRRAQARDIGGEGRHQHAALGGRDQLRERALDVGLRRALALAGDVGGIADHRPHALVAERLQARLVGDAADAGRRVDLPVAGVQQQAGRGADGERHALGDGMGDGDELDLERADLDAPAHGHDLDRDFRRAGLAQAPRFGQTRGEAAHVDGHAERGPKLGQGADVILMRVGDDEADEVALDGLHEGEVGHDEIDAGRLVAGEGQAEIDHQPFAPSRRAEAVKGAVHADFAQAAQGDKHELRVVLHAFSSNFLQRGAVGPNKATSADSMVSMSSWRRKSKRPRASRPANKPSRAPAAVVARSGSPKPAAEASQSSRKAAKPAPRAKCRKPLVETNDEPFEIFARRDGRPISAARCVAG